MTLHYAPFVSVLRSLFCSSEEAKLQVGRRTITIVSFVIHYRIEFTTKVAFFAITFYNETLF